MSSIYVCFSLKTDLSCTESNEILDAQYQAVYFPLVKFLYAHPDFNFSFSFLGNQLTYFKKRKNEFISIMKELLNRKQIEIYSGGYYNPILPLLYSMDRVEQVDLLTSDIHQFFGKKPHGITLFGDCWDSSLVNTFKNCGLDYVLLDSSIIPSNKLNYLPLHMTNLNKSIEIFPTFDSFKPDINLEPEKFISKIKKAVEKASKKDSYYQFVPDRIVNIKITFDDFIKLNTVKWFEKLYEYLSSLKDSNILLSTISNYYKNANIVKTQAYISAGISGSIAQWIGNTEKQNYPLTVYDFLEKYPTSRALNNRILYASMLVNQYKGDKIRKQAAREKLWQAQNGTGLLCTSKGCFQDSKFRQRAYKTLMEAEKILRDQEKFEETVSCFDYDNDGVNEYVCRMQNYFSYISKLGGAIQELEILKNTGNYADNLSREVEFDGVADNYERGLFVDHIIEKSQLNDYFKGESIEDGVFSRVQYNELKFSHYHHEVSLFAEAVLKQTKQKIFLKKKYIINSDGMNIQYIIRNDSDKDLNVAFVIENNLAHTNFDSDNISYYSVEVINNNQKLLLDCTDSTEKLNLSDKLNNVEAVRITDVESGVAFGFEPNEECSYHYTPLLFKRPDFMTNEVVPVSLTFVSSLIWDIKLGPGKETEKTINFSIYSVEKDKKKAFRK